MADKTDLAAMVRSVDAAVRDMGFDDKYTVMFVGLADTAKRTFRYVNAAMADPILITQTAIGPKVVRLQPTMGLVGLIPLNDVVVEKLPLSTDEMILLASDGVTEIGRLRREARRDGALREVAGPARSRARPISSPASARCCIRSSGTTLSRTTSPSSRRRWAGYGTDYNRLRLHPGSVALFLIVFRRGRGMPGQVTVASIAAVLAAYSSPRVSCSSFPGRDRARAAPFHSKGPRARSWS